VDRRRFERPARAGRPHLFQHARAGRLGLTLLPALYDTHNHLLEAARNFTMVPVDQAHSIAEFLDLIRQRAAQTPAGQ